MKILLVGCGKVGKSIVENLAKEGNEITVIDTKAEVIDNVVNEFDVAGMVGNAANHEIFIEAGVRDCDLMIAVTNSDEFNLICCLFAKKAGAKQTIARVRNPEYSKEITYIKEDLGLALIINPEMASALEISRVLRFPTAISVETFAKDSLELLEFLVPPNSILIGNEIKDLRKKHSADVLVCTVERDDEVFIPKGHFVLQEKDKITVVASRKETNAFFKQIGIKTNQTRSVIIAGGGEISFYLAGILTKIGVDVTIIEANEKRCDELCEALPKAKIINGDATEKTLLIEEGIENVEAFCALTNIDEANVMLSLFAKKVGKNVKTITKINKIEFDDIIKELDLGTICYPKKIAAERVTSFVRAMKNSMGSNVETMYRIISGKAEALEFKIKEGSEIIGKPIMDLKIKKDILVACIARGNNKIHPKGTDTIEAGDSVIIITTREGLDDISDILE